MANQCNASAEAPLFDQRVKPNIMAKINRPFPNAKTIVFAGRGLFFVRKKPNIRTKLTSNRKCATAVHRVIVPVGVKKSVKTQATTAVKFSKYRGCLLYTSPSPRDCS